MPTVLAGYITGTRCQTYNVDTKVRDIARGNKITEYFVADVLALSSALWVHKGVTCASLYSGIDINRFNNVLCTQRCVKGHPEL
ncbi:hypothetical protein Tdes44962_MAKER05720 [Teratosphaeria destructans]|uniref:Uncharacterized protein n=1 Tax=Teratosphaeria destructans TaxID=418781 RepID=A0A9W7SJ67_9PEZI|nr:hypothetical protein Tdes44962_MAKER05720 [Teratosphaeria destructans]